MTLTPDEREAAIEKMARAAYENWIAPVRDLEPAWDDLPQSHVDRLVECQCAALDAVLPLIERAANRAAFDAMSLLTVIDFDRFTEHDEALLDRVLFDVKAALADEVRT